MKQMCSGTHFESARDDRGLLHRCTTCGRVARTMRPHQVPGPTTASHDKTMGFLWDRAKELE